MTDFLVRACLASASPPVQMGNINSSALTSSSSYSSWGALLQPPQMRIKSITTSSSSSSSSYSSWRALLQPSQMRIQSSTTSSSSSSSSSCGRIWEYDVFLSFSDDCDINSVGEFYFTLLANGVKTLNHEKKKGDFCPHKLLKPIQHCRVAVVVFSKNYAESVWCLDELAMIAHCIDSVQQYVVPVFNGVDPSDVRSQTGVYHQAFAQHEERFNKQKVSKWRNAMTKVVDRYRNVTIEEIRLLRRLLIMENRYIAGRGPKYLSEREQSQVEEWEKLLHLDSNDVVRAIGICGSKRASTLASALYDRIFDKFDASCFFRINLEKFMPYGIASLQNNLLREILKDDLNIRDVRMGTMLMSTRLRNLKVLVVFDEVNDTKILEKLVGSFAWFGAGSRIIITTRYELIGWWRVDEIYRVGQFSLEESDHGARISGMDEQDMNVFLDIACFFVGEEINKVYEILSDCHYIHSQFIVSSLIEKSIISISDQKIEMHHILQAFGQELVRRENPSKPEQRSRLWFNKDTYSTLEKLLNVSVSDCTALVLNPKDLQETPIDAGAFSRLHYLRLLIIKNVNVVGVLNSLSNHLQHLSWCRFPFTHLPSNFLPTRLVRLIMRDGSINQIWTELKTTLPCLKIMDLGGSKNLKVTPDFQWLPNLERVDLQGCIKLVQLPPSVARLKRLKFLNLRDCTSLESLPNNLFGLSSLLILNLAGCSRFAACLNFNDTDISIEEEIGKQPLVPCGICEDPCAQGDCGDDFATQAIEHMLGKHIIEFSDRKAKKVKISQMGDTPEPCDEEYEIKAEEKSQENKSFTITPLEYSVDKCVAALEEIDDVSDNSYMEALERFKDPYWRQVFLTMSLKRKKSWLNRPV